MELRPPDVGGTQSRGLGTACNASPTMVAQRRGAVLAGRTVVDFLDPTDEHRVPRVLLLEIPAVNNLVHLFSVCGGEGFSIFGNP